jgi:formamidopyrimidine-DNA glycosylase
MDIVPRAKIETCRHFSGMGIEPLGNELSGETIARLFAGKRTPLKAALLDQSLIAGLGNIYVCEALFRARLHPSAQAGSLALRSGKPTEKAHRLSDMIREVLNEAVAAGGSTLRDYAQADGSLGYFQHSFRVYDREGEACARPGCRGTVKRLVQSGRSTFYCASCQRA